LFVRIPLRRPRWRVVSASGGNENLQLRPKKKRREDSSTRGKETRTVEELSLGLIGRKGEGKQHDGKKGPESPRK